MSDAEFNEFLSKLFDAIEKSLPFYFDVVTVKTKHIKICLFHGEDWGENEVSLLRASTEIAAENFKNDFAKFGYEPKPDVKFDNARQVAIVKWAAPEEN